MGSINSIDTDGAIGIILGHFSSDYITHVITDSLNMKFRPFEDEMPNMVDIIERQFNSVCTKSPDFLAKIEATRIETYNEIIRIICDFYNLTFDDQSSTIAADELYGIARTMYDIFISRFTYYMIDFFVSYIINNADSIAAYLNNDPNTIKTKESSAYSSKNFIDPKYMIIHANINQVIYNMASYDIPLGELLRYFCDQPVADRLLMLLRDNNDIYRNHYASYILDPRYSAGVLTNVKLALQGKTFETHTI